MESPEWTTECCVLCGSRNAETIHKKDRNGKPLHTIVCLECGLVRTVPMPGAGELREFYARHYRVAYQKAATPKLKRVHRAGRAAIDRAGWMAPFLRENDEFLDAGAGGGELVYLLRSKGIRAQGVEPNLAFAEFARRELGLPMEASLLEDLEYPAGRWGSVGCFHVLEHVRNPVEILGRVRRWIRPGGHLFLEVPNVENRCQHPDRRFHRAHLYNFSPVTLRRTVVRAGFQVVWCRSSPDGGNVLLAGRAEEGGGEEEAVENGYARLMEHEREWTAWRYYGSPRTWRRSADRLAGMVREWAAVRGRRSPREVLEELAGRRVNETGSMS
jgi:2-polyprenyl-3-methyl-5-hydroxy-6-metoxy-1,4-benzoquinol methylase